MKVNLSHKVLFVVAIPVLFQLGYLAFLTNSLSKLAAHQSIAQQTTNILQLRDRLYVFQIERFLSFMMFIKTFNETYRIRCLQLDEQVLKNMQAIDAVWRDDPVKRAALMAYHEGDRRDMQIAKNLLNKQDQGYNFMRGPFGINTLNKFFDAAGHPQNSIQKIIDVEEQLQATSDAQIRQTQIDLNNSLLFGLVASVLISIGSALFFSVSISNRLKSVLSNIEAMAEGTPVTKVAGGTDEIGALDAAIRSTARQIQAAEKFQTQTVRIVTAELQRPLASVASSFEQLRKVGFEQLTEKGELRLSSTDREIGRLRMLVNDLSLLETIKSAQIDLNIQDMDLAEIAEMAVGVVSEFARTKNITISHTLTSAKVLGDPDRVLQVVVNFLSNAIKFSPEHSTVTIETSSDDAGGKCSVSDCGVGIADELQSKIFGTFEQVGAVDATARAGSGLGLAISKKLVETQHGCIGFSSKLGSGSTFWFTMPTNTSASASGSNSAAIASAVTTLEKPGAKKAVKLWTPTLWLKGLALVALPLVIQLITISALWLVFDSVNENIAAANRARKLANISSAMTLDLTRGSVDAMMFYITRMPNYRRSVEIEDKKLKEQFSQFESLNTNLKATSDLSKLIQATFQLRTRMVEAPHDGTNWDQWFGANTFSLNNFLDETIRPLHGAIKEEQDSIDMRMLATSQMQQTFKFVLITSGLVTAIASALLGLFMVRQFSKRLNRILENTERLAHRNMLVEPAAGNDELAFVDRSFYEAADRLSKLEQFKQEMISVTSHELRTPLTSLMALAELVGTGVLGPLTNVGSSILVTVEENISDLIALITNLLDFEKMQSGRTLVNKQTAAIDETLNTAASAVRALSEKRRVQVDVTESLVDGSFDPHRVKQSVTAILRELVDQAPEQSNIAVVSELTSRGIELKITSAGARSRAKSEYLSGDHAARRQLAFDLAQLVVEQHGGEMWMQSGKTAFVVNMILPQ